MSRLTPEGKFKDTLNRELMQRFPGCYILKQDPHFLQGVPDILVIWKDRWAMLEAKKASNASRQANQDWYINVFNKMSFASFIDPGNMEEVLDAMESALQAAR